MQLIDIQFQPCSESHSSDWRSVDEWNKHRIETLLMGKYQCVSLHPVIIILKQNALRCLFHKTSTYIRVHTTYISLVMTTVSRQLSHWLSVGLNSCRLHSLKSVILQSTWLSIKLLNPCLIPALNYIFDQHNFRLL